MGYRRRRITRPAPRRADFKDPRCMSLIHEEGEGLALGLRRFNHFQQVGFPDFLSPEHKDLVTRLYLVVISRGPCHAS